LPSAAGTLDMFDLGLFPFLFTRSPFLFLSPFANCVIFHPCHEEVAAVLTFASPPLAASRSGTTFSLKTRNRWMILSHGTGHSFFPLLCNVFCAVLDPFARPCLLARSNHNPMLNHFLCFLGLLLPLFLEKTVITCRCFSLQRQSLSASSDSRFPVMRVTLLATFWWEIHFCGQHLPSLCSQPLPFPTPLPAAHLPFLMTGFDEAALVIMADF